MLVGIYYDTLLFLVLLIFRTKVFHRSFAERRLFLKLFLFFILSCTIWYHTIICTHNVLQQTIPYGTIFGPLHFTIYLFKTTMNEMGGDDVSLRYSLLGTISSSSTKASPHNTRSDGNSGADVAAGIARDPSSTPHQHVMSAFMLAIMLRACELYDRVPRTSIHFYVELTV